MDNKTNMLLAEIDWLYAEIKEHQEYEEELRQEIEDLKDQLEGMMGFPV